MATRIAIPKEEIAAFCRRNHIRMDGQDGRDGRDGRPRRDEGHEGHEGEGDEEMKG